MNVRTKNKLKGEFQESLFYSTAEKYLHKKSVTANDKSRQTCKLRSTIWYSYWDQKKMMKIS